MKVPQHALDHLAVWILWSWTAASNNGVEYIRDIKEKVQYAPARQKYKVYIIDEVHMLSQSAFNAFLKTLEEPPAHAVFILCTTEAYKIPPNDFVPLYAFRFQAGGRRQAGSACGRRACQVGQKLYARSD